MYKILHDVNVKNCEGSEVLPYLQANKLACHRFIDAGRRGETPGLEGKECIIHDITRTCHVSQGDGEWYRWIQHMQYL